MTTPRPRIDGDAREILLAIMLAAGADLYLGDDEIERAYLGDIEIFQKGSRYIFNVGRRDELTTGTDREPQLWAANTLHDEFDRRIQAVGITFQEDWPESSVTSGYDDDLWMIFTDNTLHGDRTSNREASVFVQGAENVPGYADAVKFWRTAEFVFTQTEPTTNPGPTYVRFSELDVRVGDTYVVEAQEENISPPQTEPHIEAAFVGTMFSEGSAQVQTDWNATSGIAQILNKPIIPSGTDTIPHAVGPSASAGTKGATYANPDHIHTLGALITLPWSRVTSKPIIPLPGTVINPVSSVGSAGRATTYSRGDHTHQYSPSYPYANLSDPPTIPSATTTPPTNVGTRLLGRSTTYALGDHSHAIGSTARIPWGQVTGKPTVYALGTSVPTPVTSTGTSLLGRATTISRSDHAHAYSSSYPWANISGKPFIPAAYSLTPTRIGAASLQGRSDSYARGDHTHQRDHAPVDSLAYTAITGRPEPYSLLPTRIGAASLRGSSTSYARGDHTHRRDHDIVTSLAWSAITGKPVIPGATLTTPSNVAGTAFRGRSTGAFARPDHIHAIGSGARIPWSQVTSRPIIPQATTGTPPAIGSAGVRGVSTQYARGDHTHMRDHAPVTTLSWLSITGRPTVPTAYTATPFAPTTTGDDGVSTRYAKGDHSHPAQTIPPAVTSLPWTAITGRPTAFTATPSRPTSAGDDGISTRYAKGDHSHPRDHDAIQPANAAPPDDTTTPGSVGTSLRYARQDHSHRAPPQQGTTYTPPAAGTAAEITAGTQVALRQFSPSVINAGIDSLLPLGATAVPPAIGSAGARGNSGNYARADHTHQRDHAPVTMIAWANVTGKPTIPAAVTSLPYSAITGRPLPGADIQQVGAANRMGTGTAYARANHVHARDHAQVTQLPWSAITSKPIIPAAVTSLPWTSITDRPTVPSPADANIQTVGTTNSAGTATAYARANHVHMRDHAPVTGLPYSAITGTPAIPVGADSGILKVGPANHAGTSIQFARQDHVHERDHAEVTRLDYSAIDNTPTIPAAVTSLPYSAITGRPLPGSTIQQVGSANLSGSGTAYARANHVHARDHAPVTSLPYSAIDGTPTIPSGTAVAPSAVGVTASAGTAGANYANPNHVHTLSSLVEITWARVTGKPSIPQPASAGIQRIGTANSPGTATTYARANHIHQRDHAPVTMLGWDAITGKPDFADEAEASDNDPETVGTAPDAGTSDEYSRSDHVHQRDHAPVTTLAYSAITGTPTIPVASNVRPEPIGTTGIIGNSTAYARANHVHQRDHAPVTALDWAAITSKPTIPDAVTSLAWTAITGRPSPATSATQVGTANAAGTSTNYARADHVHERDHAEVTELGWTSIQGRPTVPTAPTAAPPGIGSAGAIGTGTAYARANHTHARDHAPVTTLPYSAITGTPTIPDAVTSLPYSAITGRPLPGSSIQQVGSANRMGTGTAYARANHVHARDHAPVTTLPYSAITGTPTIPVIPTIPSGTSTAPHAVGATANAGTAGTTYANPDHVHAIGGTARIAWTAVTGKPTIPTPASAGIQRIGTANSPGTATTYARANHVHQRDHAPVTGLAWTAITGRPTVPTAYTSTPAAPTSGGSAGTGTNYARGNHSHPSQTIPASTSTGTYVVYDRRMITTRTYDNYYATGNNRFLWIVGGTWTASVDTSSANIYAAANAGVNTSGLTGWNTGANRYSFFATGPITQSNFGPYRRLNNITGIPAGTMFVANNIGDKRVLRLVYVPSTGGTSTGDAPTAASSAPPAIASAGAVGTSTAYARGDHTHARDHAPPLPSNANPAGVGSASSQGTSTRYSRQDHVHAAGTGGGATVAPYTSTPASPTATGTAGTSANFSRGDHAHPRQAVPTASTSRGAAPTTLGSAGTGTTYARGNHSHPLQTGGGTGTAPSASNASPASVSNLSSRVGTSTTYARGDHRHNLAGAYTLTPAASSSSGTAGTSTRWARGDHRHAQGTISVSYSSISGRPSASSATPQAVGSTGSAGSGTSYSRGNHRHALGTISYNSLSNRPSIPTGSNATPQNVGTIGARAGISRSWSRSDHRHQLQGSGQAAGNSTQMFWDGTFTGGSHTVPEDGLANYTLALITSKAGSALASLWIDVGPDGFWQGLTATDGVRTDTNSLQCGDFYIGRTDANRLVIWANGALSYKIYVQ